MDIKDIKKPFSPRRVAIAMAIISFVSFAYKMTIGILSMSLVMIIAAVPTFFVFVCKASYVKYMNKRSRKVKKKAYLIMMISTASFAVLFVLFSLLKVGGIDITHKNTFEGWVGIVFIFFIIVIFVLSIINLKGALDKTDILVTGIKEITFVSALADAVMIQDFLNRAILSYVEIPFMNYLNRFFPIGVAALMCIVPLLMLRRYLQYKL